MLGKCPESIPIRFKNVTVSISGGGEAEERHVMKKYIEEMALNIWIANRSQCSEF